MDILERYTIYMYVYDCLKNQLRVSSSSNNEND